MVRPVFILVTLLILCACSGGSGNGSDDIVTPIGAQMSISPAQIQETVTIGTPGPVSFTVQNTGDEQLTFQATTSDAWISGLENLGSVDVSAGTSSTVNMQAQCSATGQLVGCRRRGEQLSEADLRWLREMYEAEIRTLDEVLDEDAVLLPDAVRPILRLRQVRRNPVELGEDDIEGRHSVTGHHQQVSMVDLVHLPNLARMQ